MTSRLFRATFLLLSVALFHVNDGRAQQLSPAPGRIIGRISDGATGKGLPAVTIQVVGTGIGTMSGLDGRFVINNLPPGRISLLVSSIGYATKSMSDIEIDAGRAVEQNIALETEAVSVEAIEVTAAAERGSVNRAFPACFPVRSTRAGNPDT